MVASDICAQQKHNECHYDYENEDEQYLDQQTYEQTTENTVQTEQKPETEQIKVIENKKIDENTFDVALKIRANNKLKDKTIFLIEVTYNAIVKLMAPKEIEEKILLIKVPELIFPYVRSIITGVTQDSGFPPFAMASIDFNTLYESRKKMEEKTDKKS